MVKKYYIIYKTTNLKDGKFYIGMHETNNLKDGYLGSGKRLKRAIRYHGKEFFEREILHFCNSRDEMIDKEVELVDEEFIKRKDIYNLVKGGTCGFLNKAYCVKGGLNSWSKTLRLKWKDPEFVKEQVKLRSKTCTRLHKDGILKRVDWTGKKHTAKTIAKMKESQKGKQSGAKNSQYGTCWITNEKESKKIYKGDLIPEGWRLGRKI
jgi:hypothetical protein